MSDLLTKSEIQTKVEALIFAAREPISVGAIHDIIAELVQDILTQDDIEQIINSIILKYENSDLPMEVREIGDGFVFLTKPDHDDVISAYLKKSESKKLSKAAMEALSIIAYKQPITKTEVEQIRGVNSDYAIQKLLDRNLIDIVGRNEGPGRSLIYKTSASFMDYFGLRSMSDMPLLKEVNPEVNAIGTPSESLSTDN
jgi:segregation and condensation protein B